MLDIQHISKTYANGKEAVKDLTLTVEAGDIYGFIGANGAGKTTTIKAVVGIHGFDEGDIQILGHSIREEPVKCKQQFAFLPDNPNLYEQLTGYQYIDFIGNVYGVPMEKRNSIVEQYARIFELEPALDNLISSYSHGMKQRLALIAALVHGSKLLILDEPFVGLDPKGAYHLKEIMKERAAAGCAIFFSTHVLEVAEKLCNKVAIMKAGRLVANGNLDEVKGASSLETIFMELQDDE